MNARSLLLVLALLLGTAPLTVLRADENTPMFGGWSLVIHGETFSWDHAYEDNGWHYDYYIGSSSGQWVTVRGISGVYDLATVIGSSSGGSVDGFLQYGYYGDNVQSSSSGTSLSFNGRNYDTATTTTINPYHAIERKRRVVALDRARD